MIVYHRTYNAADILSGGFRDGTGTYLTGQEFTGVWFSDVPLDINDGADGDVLLSLEIPKELFECYEWIEEGRDARRR